MRKVREGRLPTRFHPSLHLCRKRGFTNTPFPNRCLRTLVTWEVACILGHNNHTTHLQPTGRWRVRMVALATLHGIAEKSNNIHIHRPSIQTTTLACSLIPPRPLRPLITPKSIIHVNHFPGNQTYHILNAGRTRNRMRFVPFSVSSIHIFPILCSSITAADCLRHTDCQTVIHLLRGLLHTMVALKAV